MVFPLTTGAKTYQILVKYEQLVGLPELRFVEVAEPAEVSAPASRRMRIVSRAAKNGLALTRDPHQAPIRPSFLPFLTGYPRPYGRLLRHNSAVLDDHLHASQRQGAPSMDAVLPWGAREVRARELLRAAAVVSIDCWVFLTTGDRQLFGGPLTLVGAGGLPDDPMQAACATIKNQSRIILILRTCRPRCSLSWRMS